jgi:hypothetical protein
MKLLLGFDHEIELKNHNHQIISDTLRNFQQFLKKNFEKVYFVTNQEYFIPGIILTPQFNNEVQHLG